MFDFIKFIDLPEQITRKNFTALKVIVFEASESGLELNFD
jgi:hypothetical protein